jgi:amidohydrolase
VKSAAREVLDQQRDSLVDLSQRIHATPELGFEEEKSSVWLSEFLDAGGFQVVHGAFELPTAFVARKGSGPLHIALCAEYDSLPGIGHACGHNLIAAMSVGAALAAARLADDLGITVTVLGTPAEEVGDSGGKILMLERGAFDGVHASMMVHPAPFDAVKPRIIASSMFEVEYRGREAHAAAFPQLGINAADAMTIAQTAIGLVRQHICPTDRVHGICTHGGDAPNIVPARTRAKYMIRSERLDELEALRGKIHRCFEAGAVATGCNMEIIGGTKPYAHMVHDVALASLYEANAIELGRNFTHALPMMEAFAASTDMGNVSQVIPSIHPLISINSLPAVNHQPEFTAHCITPSAEKALYDGALAMAWTIVDMARNEQIRTRLIERPEGP